MRMRYWRDWGVLLLGGVLLLAACDDSPTDTTPPPVADAVEVTPAQVTFQEIGESVTLEAVVLDEDGEVIEDAQVTWGSDDEAVVTVDESGVATAEGEGTATVTATSGEASFSVQVTVEAGD